jgi:hypothetical protein
MGYPDCVSTIVSLTKHFQSQIETVNDTCRKDLDRLKNEHLLNCHNNEAIMAKRDELISQLVAGQNMALSELIKRCH